MNVTGTLAVVLLAKQYGLNDYTIKILNQLRSAGFRLDDAIIQEALARTVEENWKAEK